MLVMMLSHHFIMIFMVHYYCKVYSSDMGIKHIQRRRFLLFIPSLNGHDFNSVLAVVVRSREIAVNIILKPSRCFETGKKLKFEN